jgi:hypothetical protein
MSLIGLKMQQDLVVVILYGSIYNQYKIVKRIWDLFYELQCLAFSSSVIYLWPDDGLVIEAETFCHLK